MKRLFSKVMWGIIAGLFAVLTAASIVLTYVANANSAAVNMALNTSTIQTVNDPDVVATDFYTTDYKFERNGENMYAEDAAAIEEAEAEGAVLLWNKGSSLPLEGAEKVSLLGRLLPILWSAAQVLALQELSTITLAPRLGLP